MSLPILFNTEDRNQDGYLDQFNSTGRGLDQAFVRGDKNLLLSLRPVVPSLTNIRPWDDDYLPGDTFQIAIGNPDTAPVSGTFVLILDGDSTAALTMDAATIQSALSAAHGGSYGTTTVVLQSPGVWKVTWNTVGTVPQLNAGANNLSPDSVINTIVDKAGDGSTHAVQFIILRQSPVAYTNLQTAITSSSAANPSVITCASNHFLSTGDTVVIAGHTGSTPDINGNRIATVTSPTTFTIPVNVTVGGTGGTFTKLAPPADVVATVTQAGDGTHSKSYAIDFTPGTYGGTFGTVLTNKDNTATNVGFASGTVSAQAYQAQLLTATGLSAGDISVTRTGDTLNVQFQGTQSNSNTCALVVTNQDLLAPKGPSGVMQLNTVSLYNAFWASGSQTGDLEFTLAIRRTRADSEDAELFQHKVTLKRNIIDVTTMTEVLLPSYYTAAQTDAAIAAAIAGIGGFTTYRQNVSEIGIFTPDWNNGSFQSVYSTNNGDALTIAAPTNFAGGVANFGRTLTICVEYIPNGTINLDSGINQSSFGPVFPITIPSGGYYQHIFQFRYSAGVWVLENTADGPESTD